MFRGFRQELLAVFECRHPQNADFKCKTKAKNEKNQKYLDLPILQGGEGLSFQRKSMAERSASGYQMTGGASAASRLLLWRGFAGRAEQERQCNKLVCAKSIHAQALQADP